MSKKSIRGYTEATTINEVLNQLDHIIEQTIDQESYLCAFAYVYRKTTHEVKKAIETGRFEDPERMEQLDVVFANLYIKAFFSYHYSFKTCESWTYAFNAEKEKLAIIQHILLGMNVHINLDLAVAAATITDGTQIIALKNDFMVINQILAELTNTMQKGLGKASFMMKLLDFFGFRSDEKIINFSIRKARDFAWINAMELALLPAKERKMRMLEIDKRVVQISKIIKDPPGKLLPVLLKITSLFESSQIDKVIDKMRKA